MFLRITFKLWRKYRNQKLTEDGAHKIDFDHDEDLGENEDKQYSMRDHNVSARMLRKIYPNQNIITSKLRSPKRMKN